MRPHSMEERDDWSLLRRLPVSDSARLALYGAAAERRKAEPDKTVTRLAGEIIDESLCRHLDISD